MGNRLNAMCPNCFSLERHRFLWVFLNQRKLFNNYRGKKVLHIAAEKCFISKFAGIFGDGYLTADLYKDVMVRMDITNIEYPDEIFDGIICNHVLEHVVDDLKAINEFHRVLKKDGWASIMVPITTEKTWEDNSIVTPEARQKAFGQFDHVRAYGVDFAERLSLQGFEVNNVSSADFLTDEEIHSMRIVNEMLFFCTKK
jgi:SAM-dependent methyltransferase